MIQCNFFKALFYTMHAQVGDANAEPMSLIYYTAFAMIAKHFTLCSLCMLVDAPHCPLERH